VIDSPQRRDAPCRSSDFFTHSWGGKKMLFAGSSARRRIETRFAGCERGRLRQAFQALIFARTGETDRAIAEIERLLTTPFTVDYADESITLSDLRSRWEWDPLRMIHDFQKS